LPEVYYTLFLGYLPKKIFRQL